METICSEAEEGNGDWPWEVLYDYVVDPAASQPGQGDLWDVFTHGNISPFIFWSWWLLGNISFSPHGYYFAALLALSLVNEAILVWAKDSNGTIVRTFSKFNLLRCHCTLLPFQLSLVIGNSCRNCRHALEVWTHWWIVGSALGGVNGCGLVGSDWISHHIPVLLLIQSLMHCQAR